jgi:hypothetical protein
MRCARELPGAGDGNYMIIVTGLAGVSNCASSLMALARLKLCVAVVFSGAPLIFTPWRQFFDRIGAQFSFRTPSAEDDSHS